MTPTRHLDPVQQSLPVYSNPLGFAPVSFFLRNNFRPAHVKSLKLKFELNLQPFELGDCRLATVIPLERATSSEPANNSLVLSEFVISITFLAFIAICGLLPSASVSSREGEVALFNVQIGCVGGDLFRLPDAN